LAAIGAQRKSGLASAPTRPTRALRIVLIQGIILSTTASLVAMVAVILLPIAMYVRPNIRAAAGAFRQALA